MSNEKITELPSVASALTSDIIYAVQGGVSVQETLQQVLNLGLSNTVLTFAGNPNTNLAGSIYQLCYDTTNKKFYICTTTGSALTAVWTLIGANVVAPVQGGTGVSNPTAHTLPVGEGSSNFTFLGPLTNGQLLIGSTGADPVAAALTAGTNISVTNGAGSISIASTGHASVTWTNVTGTSATMTSNKGYIANNAGLVTLTLPATSVIGDELLIVGTGAGGWTIAQAAGQSINASLGSTTVGVGGSLSSTNRYDSVNLVCTAANTTWSVWGGIDGTLTIV